MSLCHVQCCNCRDVISLYGCCVYCLDFQVLFSSFLFYVDHVYDQAVLKNNVVVPCTVTIKALESFVSQQFEGLVAEEQLLECQRSSRVRTPRQSQPEPARQRPRQWQMPARNSRKRTPCGRKLTNMSSKKNRER